MRCAVFRHEAVACSSSAFPACADRRRGRQVVHAEWANLLCDLFRGRGVQTALLEGRLAAAEAAVCDLAVVMTTPGTPSQRNVERAGFRTAYTFARMVKGV